MRMSQKTGYRELFDPFPVKGGEIKQGGFAHMRIPAAADTGGDADPPAKRRRIG